MLDDGLPESNYFEFVAQLESSNGKWWRLGSHPTIQDCENHIQQWLAYQPTQIRKSTRHRVLRVQTVVDLVREPIGECSIHQ
jgi:hypothetical protein